MAVQRVPVGVAVLPYPLNPLETIEAMWRQRTAVRSVGHRPWVLPDRPWVMGQTWDRLLFAHWRVPPEALADSVPAELPLDLFDGDAWIGLTPFEVSALRPRLMAPVPWAGWFPELNVRTYVSVGGKPGIYFFSLDAASRAAVAAARRTYRLPYFRADIEVSTSAGFVSYDHRRVDEDGPPASFAATYAPSGEPFQAEPGSLDHWLTERYCLYSLDEERRPLRGEIHHRPWPLQRAKGDIETNTMTDSLGIALDGEPVMHFAERQDVVFWTLDG